MPFFHIVNVGCPSEVLFNSYRQDLHRIKICCIFEKAISVILAVLLPSEMVALHTFLSKSASITTLWTSVFIKACTYVLPICTKKSVCYAAVCRILQFRTFLSFQCKRMYFLMNRQISIHHMTVRLYTRRLSNQAQFLPYRSFYTEDYKLHFCFLLYCPQNALLCRLFLVLPRYLPVHRAFSYLPIQVYLLYYTFHNLRLYTFSMLHY